jgi:hypothetical protein
MGIHAKYIILLAHREEIQLHYKQVFGLIIEMYDFVHAEFIYTN